MFKKLVDKIVEREVNKRRFDTELRIKKEETHLLEEHKLKVEKLDAVTKEVTRVRIKAEQEQENLWKKLDILRDNLNAEQIFSKLWEMAYSKAVDAVWAIFKKETLHLAENARIDGLYEGEKKAKEGYDKQLNSAIVTFQGAINAPLLFKRRQEIEEQFLVAQRSKDRETVLVTEAQLNLLKEVTNGKAS